MRSVQPQGPYHLLGWSLGGVIAHAMAVELRSTGEEVALLAVMDSFVDNAGLPPEEMLTVEELLGGLGLAFDADHRDGELTYARAVELLNESFGQETGLTTEHLRRINAGFVNSSRIMHRFTPAVFDGELLFFTAARSAGENGHRHSAAEWKNSVTGAIREFELDCEHNQMIEPSVLATIGPILEEHIAQN